MAEFQIAPENLSPIKDKVVLITGSSSGIGKATVKLCLSLGAKVIAGDLNPLPKEPLLDSSNGETLIFVKTDVTDWGSIRNLFITGYDHFGRIDHVFANAGIAASSSIIDEAFEGDDETLLAPPRLDTVNVNFLGVINTVRLGVFYLRRSAAAEGSTGGGQKSIVLTASASSFQNFSVVDYTAAKHGVLGIMRGLAVPLKEEGVMRMNAIAPSWTATGIVPKEVLESVGATVQGPEVVAESVVLLFNDPGKHGELIYSWAGRYLEINNCEGGLLDAALKLLPTDSEGDEMEKLKEMAKQAANQASS